MFVATDIYILSSSITMMALQVPIWRIHLMINLDDPLEIYYISHRWNKRWGRRKRKTKNKAQNWRRW
jgi:type IV secretory pathway VirB3-like protein